MGISSSLIPMLLRLATSIGNSCSEKSIWESQNLQQRQPRQSRWTRTWKGTYPQDSTRSIKALPMSTLKHFSRIKQSSLMLLTMCKHDFTSMRNVFRPEYPWLTVALSGPKVTFKLWSLTKQSLTPHKRTPRQTTRSPIAPLKCSQKRRCIALSGQKTSLETGSRLILRATINSCLEMTQRSTRTLKCYRPQKRS